MNRKQTIILSLTGIFLVLLILLGLTYAYFLTEINGNTASTSIELTTAELELTYGDGNGSLTPANKLNPGDSLTFKTANGTTTNEKTFTVKNDGDETDYVVIVDNVTITKNGVETTFESNDFEYNLTCTSSDSNPCDGITASTFPLKNQSILVGNEIAAGVTHTYTLTMKYKETNKDQSADMGKSFTARINIEDIRRINPYSNNTNSLAYNIINNSISAKNNTQLMSTPLTKVAEEVSLYTNGNGNEVLIPFDITESGLASKNPNADFDFCFYGDYDEEGNPIEGDCTGIINYSSCDESLIGMYVYNDLDYSVNGPVEGCVGEKIAYFAKPERVLSITQDDYGTSYYYRGSVEDNYVNFAGLCWRIVRIDGNGNIKLILQDNATTCDNSSYSGNYNIGKGNFGYEVKNFNNDAYNEYIMNYIDPITNPDKSMAKAFYDYQSTLSTKIATAYDNKTISDYLTSGNWCLDDTAYLTESVDLSTSIPLTKTEISNRYSSMKVFYYGSYIRLYGNRNTYGYNPSLKCNGTIMNKFKNVTVDNTTITTETDMYVGTLTADEIVYAGDTVMTSNYMYYLGNDFRANNWGSWWTLSPYNFRNHSAFDGVFLANPYGYGGLQHEYVEYERSFRPSILLKSSVEISAGTGSHTNPYVIK